MADTDRLHAETESRAEKLPRNIKTDRATAQPPPELELPVLHNPI